MSTSNAQESSNRWVAVSWMPHTSLAPSSHVTLSVRSAHACLLDPRFSSASSLHSEMGATATTGKERTSDLPYPGTSIDWNIRISIHGYGGVELVPIDCRTPSAPLTKRSSETRDWFFRPTVSQATHDCRWNFFRVVEDNGDVVRQEGCGSMRFL
jgi:hypothetical protein